MACKYHWYRRDTFALLVNHVNPQWVRRLLGLLEMNVHYQHSSGTELFTDDGRLHSRFPFWIQRS